MSFVPRVLANAVAIWLAAAVLSGLEVVGGETTGTRVLVYLGVALLFGMVNAVVKPLVQLLSIPLYILTLGLFTLVVNALMLMLTGWFSELTSYGLRVSSFGTAVIGALIISVVSFLISVMMPKARRRD